MNNDNSKLSMKLSPLKHIEKQYRHLVIKYPENGEEHRLIHPDFGSL